MAFFEDIYHIRFFLQKGKFVLRFLLSEDRYFQGDRYFRDLLTPVTFYRYFRRFASVEGSLRYITRILLVLVNSVLKSLLCTAYFCRHSILKNACASLPFDATNDRKQFLYLNMVFHNKTGIQLILFKNIANSVTQPLEVRTYCCTTVRSFGYQVVSLHNEVDTR